MHLVFPNKEQKHFILKILFIADFIFGDELYPSPFGSLSVSHLWILMNLKYLILCLYVTWYHIKS